MKKSLLKNNIKEISKTRRRFISILIMAFLGVGFYAGLNATSPDMLESLDSYADNSNMYDIQVISTLGLTDDDINAIKQIDGIDKAYGIQTKEALSKTEGKEKVCKIIEYNENINKPNVSEGRMPETSNECLLDSRYTIEEDVNSLIGKKIILENDDTNEDGSKVLTQTEFTIVGIAETPIYISSERGNTNIGNGTVSFYIFTKDVINMDYYTGVYVTAKGAKETVTNSDEYLSIINSVTSEIEAIKETRENARYKSLVDEATKKVNDAQKEFDDKQQDVEAELQDAENQIKNAENQITSSERKIQNGEKELNAQIERANAQFTSAKAQIENAENQLEAAPLEDAVKEAQKAELLKQKQALEASQKEAEAKFEQARTEIANNKAEIRKAKSKLSSSKAEFNDKKQEAQDKLDEAQSKIDDAKNEISKIEKCKWYIQDRLDNSGYNNIFDAIKTMSNISKLFPVIFYFVAVLISLTSMTRMIEEERIEIGTLKALGYTNTQIILKYIIYSLFACILGGAFGMIVGLYLIPNIVWIMYSMIYSIPKFYSSFRFDIGLLGTIISFICIGGATILVAVKELKQMPSVLMRPKPPKKR